MLFIDMEQIRPRIRSLLPGLAAAHRKVMAECDPVLRAKLINEHRSCWVAFRAEFDEYSCGKCWYVECRNPGTDDDIDHFRPKLRVYEDPGHPGYFWLAFCWKNYRLSCHRANRARANPEMGEVGGKADHFPLVPDSPRSLGPGDDLRLEIPALLDPTNPTDVLILSFQPSGEIEVSPGYKIDPVAVAKIDASRLYLHLDWPKFKEGRMMVYNRIERLVQRGEESAPEDCSGQHCASVEFKNVISDLIDMTKPKNEYSAAATLYIRSFRHVWWIEQIVLELIARSGGGYSA